jgi:ABC-type uncharacterized transport system substrate-binding protein
MRRIGLAVALSLVLTLASLVSQAQEQQTGKMSRVGRLTPTTAAISTEANDGFREGMRALGWAEGKSYAIETRYADGVAGRLPGLAAELVRLNVDVILAGSIQGALAAKNATATIPIVMVTSGDPVALALVASLARPGGNVTGVTVLGQELSAKRLELLKEVVPSTNRVAVLCDPTVPDTAPTVNRVRETAQALGVQLRVWEIRDPSELEKAFAAMSSERLGALLVLPDILLNQYRRRIVQLANNNRMSVVYPFREHVEAGGLMFYGATFREMYRRAASHVDKILKGAKPADIPVEQPTKFELVINLKTARALGLTIPQTLLLRADQVIQ